MKRRPICLPKSKEVKKEKKEKEKEENCNACLETRARSEGYMAKAFKAWCSKPNGWEPPTYCSLHGWMGGVEQVVSAGVSKSFEVRGET